MFSLESRNLLSCLYLKTNLPLDLISVIILKSEKNIKNAKRDLNFKNFCRGKSKYAARRRAKQVDKCLECGNFTHIGRCRPMPSYSQSECAVALRKDPVRLKAEGSLRPNSNAEAMIDELVSRRASKLRLNSLF